MLTVRSESLGYKAMICWKLRFSYSDTLNVGRAYSLSWEFGPRNSQFPTITTPAKSKFLSHRFIDTVNLCKPADLSAMPSPLTSS